MLFFTRAFLCIGAIVALAEGVNLAGLIEPEGSVVKHATRQGTDVVTRFCKTDMARCLAVATAAVEAARTAGAPETPIVRSKAPERTDRVRPSSQTKPTVGRN